MAYDLGDYVDVKTRIERFREIYPEGSLQFEFKGQMPGSSEYIWGIAYAYRTPDDQRPAMGTASEAAQGKTAFTRGSELANLETSCWGRALGSLGIGISNGLASKQEVENAKQREVERRMPVHAESDPWALDQASPVEMALTAMGATPMCGCGSEMTRKTGNRKSDGKAYAGWVCANGNPDCKAIWDK